MEDADISPHQYKSSLVNKQEIRLARCHIRLIEDLRPIRLSQRAQDIVPIEQGHVNPKRRDRVLFRKCSVNDNPLLVQRQ